MEDSEEGSKIVEGEIMESKKPYCENPSEQKLKNHICELEEILEEAVAGFGGLSKLLRIRGCKRTADEMDKLFIRIEKLRNKSEKLGGNKEVE